MSCEEFNSDSVRNIIANRLGKDVSLIVDDANFEADLGADNSDLIEMAMDLEDKYGIKNTKERYQLK